MKSLPKSVLVANRAEIACRIFRTLKNLGIESIGIFSEADISQKHARLADRAYVLNGRSPKDTYLNIERIIEIAKLSGAQAIHPGYGFLSENADFASAVREAGILYVGPKSDAIKKMGSKIEAKEIAKSVGVPTLPSAYISNPDSPDILDQLADFEFPVLIKAAMGGGGRGMRSVYDMEELIEAIRSASREALSAFGDGTVFVEPLVKKPRHIELQILADSFGNCVSLFERECSIQRRHQKIIEESPSPVIKPEIRREIGGKAVELAKAIHYENAGTVEFVYDDVNERFSFLEVNTRLQVEHPVTEFVTGLDIVKEQIFIAAGYPLSEEVLEAANRGPIGHSIEVRIYAEDPIKNWQPSSGEIHTFEIDKDLARVDSGYDSNSTVPIEYDSMIAKVISYGNSREIARKKLHLALRKAKIFGVKTNRALLESILEDEEFIAGKIDTEYFDRKRPQVLLKTIVPASTELEALYISALLASVNVGINKANIPFKDVPIGYRNLYSQPQSKKFYYYSADEEAPREAELRYRFVSEKLLDISLNGVQLDTVDLVNRLNCEFIYRGQYFKFECETVKDRVYVYSNCIQGEFKELPRFKESQTSDAPGSLYAPMPGTVTSIHVELGQEVTKGQALVSIEAMKMEMAVNSPSNGRVKEIKCSAGSQVAKGQVLILVEENE